MTHTEHEDRELLERAARAAGMTKRSDCYWTDFEHCIRWNPLIDDGDAFRLAVALDLNNRSYYSGRDKRTVVITRGESREILAEVYGDAGDAAVWREAIVRAAASLDQKGKG